jgi:hypothetical protein
MVNYNEGGSNTRQKEVGENCTLFLPEGTQVAVSNVSFSEEANTSEVQYTDSFAQSIAVTGVSYSGSFTIPGNANVERDQGWNQGNGEPGTTLPQYISTMSIQDGEGRTYSFSSVLLNSHSKDIPSDDRTEQSFDFMAETVTVTDS